jgi:hypothetical protein
VPLQAGWTADDEAVLHQLRPPSKPDSAAQYPPLLLLVNKCDLAAASGLSDPATADCLRANGVPLAAGSAATGAHHQDSQAAVPRNSNPAASPIDTAIPAAVRGAASAVVHTSAKTGEGLQALKQAVLTLTDTPQLSGGAPQPVSGGALTFPDSWWSGHC